MVNDRVLIAEDDALLAQDLQERLEGLGYQVPTNTALPQEAVTLTGTLKPDLVLMDISFPGDMDGIQAAQQIHALDVPVVFVTGYCDGPMIERAKRTEPYGYILKPYKTPELQAVIEIALHKHNADQEREKIHAYVKDALAHVKTIEGLLSICAYCKKIKDQAGLWDEVETYVKKHSTASFTHGMCPDCFQRVKKQIEALDQHGMRPGSLLLG